MILVLLPGIDLLRNPGNFFSRVDGAVPREDGLVGWEERVGIPDDEFGGLVLEDALGVEVDLWEEGVVV